MLRAPARRRRGPDRRAAHALPVQCVRLGLPEYLLLTWHPRTRPSELTLDPTQRWTRLDIVSTRSGGPFDSAGQVAFRAWWRSDDDRGTLEETSDFVREQGRWFYVDGVVA